MYIWFVWFMWKAKFFFIEITARKTDSYWCFFSPLLALSNFVVMWNRYVSVCLHMKNASNTCNQVNAMKIVALHSKGSTLICVALLCTERKTKFKRWNFNSSWNITNFFFILSRFATEICWAILNTRENVCFKRKYVVVFV